MSGASPEPLLGMLAMAGFVRAPEVAVTSSLAWLAHRRHVADGLAAMVERSGLSVGSDPERFAEVLAEDGTRTDLKCVQGDSGAPVVVVEAKLDAALTSEQPRWSRCSKRWTSARSPPTSCCDLTSHAGGLPKGAVMSTPTDPNWTDGSDESGPDGESADGFPTQRLALASAPPMASRPRSNPRSRTTPTREPRRQPDDWSHGEERQHVLLKSLALVLGQAVSGVGIDAQLSPRDCRGGLPEH